jgi:hypothetical protein
VHRRPGGQGLLIGAISCAAGCGAPATASGWLKVTWLVGWRLGNALSHLDVEVAQVGVQPHVALLGGRALQPRAQALVLGLDGPGRGREGARRGAWAAAQRVWVGWGGRILMREAFPGEPSYVGLARVAGAKSARAWRRRASRACGTCPAAGRERGWAGLERSVQRHARFWRSRCAGSPHLRTGEQPAQPLQRSLGRSVVANLGCWPPFPPLPCTW